MKKVHIIQFVIAANMAVTFTMAMAIPEEHATLSYRHEASQLPHQDSRMLMPKTRKST
jgi:hypothetical protein